MLDTIGYIIKHFLLGILYIFVINIIGQSFDFNIPINIFTIAILGFFKIPGLVFIILIMII